MASKKIIPRVCIQCGESFMARISEVNRGDAKLCGPKCRVLYVSKLRTGQRRAPGSGRPTHDVSTAETWFWPNVSKGGDSECWLWHGHVDDHGYGRLGMLGRKQRAHQIAYMLRYGRAKGLVCHKCNNKLCCNPSHLYDGTHYSNTQDRKLAGVYIGSPGEINPHAKLTTASAIEILNSKEPRRVLADRYGVGRQIIWLIRSGRAWKHLSSTVEACK